MAARIHAYDTRTGKKLPAAVPEAWLRIFPHLSATPQQQAHDSDTADTQDSDTADTSEPETEHQARTTGRRRPSQTSTEPKE